MTYDEQDAMLNERDELPSLIKAARFNTCDPTIRTSRMPYLTGCSHFARELDFLDAIRPGWQHAHRTGTIHGKA